MTKNLDTTLNDLAKNWQKYPKSQRYRLLVMVSSVAWMKNGKVSVWVEDPSDKGITIMCSFDSSSCSKMSEDGFLQVNAQYVIENGLIVENPPPKKDQTFALYQLLLDKESTIKKVKDESRMRVVYRPKLLRDIHEYVSNEQVESRVDIVAVPFHDFGLHRYKDDEGEMKVLRRILLRDDSGGRITWTLWDEDAENEEAICKLMKRPVLIRNGLAGYFGGFDEYQIRKPLIAIRIDLSLPRMQELAEWAKSGE